MGLGTELQGLSAQVEVSCRKDSPIAWGRASALGHGLPVLGEFDRVVRQSPVTSSRPFIKRKAVFPLRISRCAHEPCIADFRNQKWLTMHLAESQQTPSQTELFLLLFLKGLFDVCSSCDWHGVVQFFLSYHGELWMRRLRKDGPKGLEHILWQAVLCCSGLWFHRMLGITV